MLFQKNILKKYLATLDNNAVENAWNLFKAYFLNPDIQQNIRQSKEEQFQEGFLRELFVKVLGYTLNPTPGYNLVTEKTNESNAQKADGAMLIDNNVIGIIELKDVKTTDLGKIENQAFGYKNRNRNARYVITSNFEKLRLYIDNAVDYEEFNLFTLKEDDFRSLYLTLSFENVSKQTAIKMIAESISREEQITKELYTVYSKFKDALYEDVCANMKTDGSSAINAGELSVLQLYNKIQKLLDRFLFILFAEDCGLLDANTTQKIISQWKTLKELDAYQPLYSRIKQYFGYLNQGFKSNTFDIYAYNGGLFKPDAELDGLVISDDILEKYLLQLSEYDYKSEVDVNILGHIFECSLNENNNHKRKGDGVFYTPQYITKYIVESTVGKLCIEKKASLGIDEQEYLADVKRKKDKKKRLLETLDTYRKWLLQITILDPACGSGAFLNAALKFLVAEHNLIDEMVAAITGASMVIPDVEISILENNLFGVDINEEAVGIAKLSLWLRTAKRYRKLNNLNNNIKCGNSLISDPSIAGDKAFNWEKEFPQVFEKGGFDVVIGNPPYVNAIELKKKYSEIEYKFLKGSYKTAKGTVDLYIYFFEKGLSLISNNGFLAYITPNRYLSASYGTALRQFIIKDFSLEKVIDYSDKKVFADASTYPVITIISKGRKNTNVFCGKIKDEGIVGKEYPSEKLDILENSILGFLLNDKLAITQKVMRQSVSLSVVGNINATSTAKEADEYSDLIREKETGFKLINTGTIDRYFSTWGYTPLTKQGKQFITPYLPMNCSNISNNRKQLYSTSKIIISKIGLNCEAFYDKHGEYASIDTNCICNFAVNYLPEYILCWLNSKLYNYIFECLFDGLKMSGGYLLYSAPNLKKTCIKEISLEQQHPFIAFADKMLVLHKNLQDKKSRFHHRLETNFAGLKITASLQNFENLEFKDLLTELKKQKQKLSFSEQDELEDYFNTYKTECLSITNDIKNTDDDINKRVYDMYGLTDEEIMIVENNIPS